MLINISGANWELDTDHSKKPNSTDYIIYNIE
jgi:hypothetical protein